MLQTKIRISNQTQAIQHFIEKIQMNYSQFRDKLKIIKNKINNQPANIGTLKYKWSNAEFTNRLFEMI